MTISVLFGYVWFWGLPGVLLGDTLMERAWLTILERSEYSQYLFQIIR